MQKLDEEVGVSKNKNVYREIGDQNFCFFIMTVITYIKFQTIQAPTYIKGHWKSPPPPTLVRNMEDIQTDKPNIRHNREHNVMLLK